MTNGTSYPYADGDRLDERNTYFYTPVSGRPFLDAWIAQRDGVLASLPPPAPDIPDGVAPVPPSADGNQHTRTLLEFVIQQLLNGAAEAAETKIWLDRLVAKFEVTKRIHPDYDAEFRALEPDHYRDLSLYVKLARIFELAYAATQNIVYLNALLKVIDTLSSVKAQLPNDLRATLAWLIVREKQHVIALAEKVGST